LECCQRVVLEDLDLVEGDFLWVDREVDRKLHLADLLVLRVNLQKL